MNDHLINEMREHIAAFLSVVSTGEFGCYVNPHTALTLKDNYSVRNFSIWKFIDIPEIRWNSHYKIALFESRGGTTEHKMSPKSTDKTDWQRTSSLKINPDVQLSHCAVDHGNDLMIEVWGHCGGTQLSFRSWRLPKKSLIEPFESKKIV